MPITELLERNSREFPDDIALVELNPMENDSRRMSWKEYDLIPEIDPKPYRREISWRVFNEKANRFAHLLLHRGVKKEDKVGILLMKNVSFLWYLCEKSAPMLEACNTVVYYIYVIGVDDISAFYIFKTVGESTS